jgi:hypothetical protein
MMTAFLDSLAVVILCSIADGAQNLFVTIVAVLLAMPFILECINELIDSYFERG